MGLEHIPETSFDKNNSNQKFLQVVDGLIHTGSKYFRITLVNGNLEISILDITLTPSIKSHPEEPKEN